ncbi:1-acyl-sn-glycerol-3-phosphate acyltransferase alpha-like [Saccoglossus kowalevskii]
MELSWFQVVTIVLLLIIPVLYECNKTVRFYAKYVSYQFMILIVGLVTIPFALRKPGDVTNQSWAAWATKTLVKPLFGVKMTIEGEENLKSDTPLIAICNHQSFIDFIGMMEIYPERCTALAKKSLKYAGTFGLGCWLSGIIFIERFRPDRAKDTIGEAVDIINKKNFVTVKFTIKILPPISTKGKTLDDVPEMVEKVRQIMLDTYNEISRKDKGLGAPT